MKANKSWKAINEVPSEDVHIDVAKGVGEHAVCLQLRRSDPYKAFSISMTADEAAAIGMRMLQLAFARKEEELRWFKNGG